MSLQNATKFLKQAEVELKRFAKIRSASSSGLTDAQLETVVMAVAEIMKLLPPRPPHSGLTCPNCGHKFGISVSGNEDA